MSAPVAVIIPTLDEAPRLARCVERLGPADGRYELLVADGGSSDDTVARATRLGATVVNAPRGRAPQMNAGASATTAPRLLFLHADTLLPPGWWEEVMARCADPAVSLGSFRFALDTRGAEARRMRWIERGVGLRNWLWALPYGDQALYLRREMFDALGGYQPLRVGEDLDLVLRARRLGRVHVGALPALTCARRWRRRGTGRTTLRNLFILARFCLGWRPPLAPSGTDARGCPHPSKRLREPG